MNTIKLNDKYMKYIENKYGNSFFMMKKSNFL